MATIVIELKDGQVKRVEITTASLFMRPIAIGRRDKDGRDDRANYGLLFGGLTHMQSYGDGTTWDSDVVDRNFNMWLNRWIEVEGKTDPLSAVAIFFKDGTFVRHDDGTFIGHDGTFAGHIVLGHGGSGCAELAMILRSEFCHHKPHGYGKEAVEAMLEYAVELHKQGLLKERDGTPITRVSATYNRREVINESDAANLTASAKIAEYIAEMCGSNLAALSKDDTVLYRNRLLPKTRVTIDVELLLRAHLGLDHSEVHDDDADASDPAFKC